MAFEDFLKRVSTSTQHKRFYHFTDRKNLDSIRKHGLLCTSELKRLKLFDKVVPGGDSNSQTSDHATGTDKYVCLCFTSNHPMCHVANQDGRIADPVYLRIDPEIITLSGVMVTNAASNQKGVERIPASSGLSSLDLDVIYTRMDWTNAEIHARLSLAEKYEILVPKQVPIKYIVHGL
jgi:hypothetical protein